MMLANLFKSVTSNIVGTEIPRLFSLLKGSIPMKSVSINRIRLFDCVYCGMDAVARDHIRPHSYDSDGSVDRTFKFTEVVPVCKECNSLLSNLFYPTIAERADYIAMKLQFRYRKELETPEWAAAELQELGTKLRAFVRKNIHKQKIVKARIEFATSMSKNTSMTPRSYWQSMGYNVYSDIDPYSEESSESFDAVKAYTAASNASQMALERGSDESRTGN